MLYPEAVCRLCACLLINVEDLAVRGVADGVGPDLVARILPLCDAGKQVTVL